MRALIGFLFALTGLATLVGWSGDSLKDWVGVILLMLAGAMLIDIH